MNFSEIKIENPDFIIDSIRVYHYRSDGNFKINVFFIEADAIIINDSWKRLSNMVAANYQNSEYMSNNEFDKWNFYIIYISKENISKEIKNKIENDKFSSRKIVQDFYTEKLNVAAANNLIVKHITNSDLKGIVDDTQEVTISEYVPKYDNIWKLLEIDEKIIGDRNAQEELIKKINAL